MKLTATCKNLGLAKLQGIAEASLTLKGSIPSRLYKAQNLTKKKKNRATHKLNDDLQN
jgi:hypothetical protein